MVGGETRQVFDLPKITVEVTEHVAERLVCGCGKLSCGVFPVEATAAACWGPKVKALGVYGEIDLLPGYRGVIVHDGLAAYDYLSVALHAQCGAHSAERVVMLNGGRGLALGALRGGARWR